MSESGRRPIVMRSAFSGKLSPTRPPPARMTSAAPSSATTSPTSTGTSSPVSSMRYVAVAGSTGADFSRAALRVAPQREQQFAPSALSNPHSGQWRALGGGYSFSWPSPAARPARMSVSFWTSSPVMTSSPPSCFLRRRLTSSARRMSIFPWRIRRLYEMSTSSSVSCWMRSLSSWSVREPRSGKVSIGRAYQRIGHTQAEVEGGGRIAREIRRSDRAARSDLVAVELPAGAARVFDRRDDRHEDAEVDQRRAERRPSDEPREQGGHDRRHG